MKISDLDPSKVAVSVKMYYQGEQWEIGQYVDAESCDIEDIITDAQNRIKRIAPAIANCLRRQNIANKLTDPTYSE